MNPFNANRILNLPPPVAPIPIDPRNRFERYFDEYIRPAGRFTEQLIQPIDPQTGMPNIDIAGPVMVGPKGAINAAKILKQIRESNPQTAAQAAVEYLKRKYPKLSNLPERFGQIPGINVASGVEGFYSPNKNIAVIVDKPGILPEEFVETGAHELTHGYQWNKQKRFAELLSPSQGGRYIPGTLPKSFDEIITDDDLADILAKHQFDMYAAQPVEVEARRGGKTARKTFDKFLRKATGLE